jgi:hypothetical protein
VTVSKLLQEANIGDLDAIAVLSDWALEHQQTAQEYLVADAESCEVNGNGYDYGDGYGDGNGYGYGDGKQLSISGEHK